MTAANAQGIVTGAALREAKRRLRESTQAARDALPVEMRATSSQRIAQAIAALPSFAPARTVLVTLPFRSEWDSRLLVAIALAGGKTVVAPRVNPATRMLSMHCVVDLERDVGPGHREIPEPLPHCREMAAAGIDWVLVPGVAFDAGGRRLGYGGGYYDRLLPLLPRDAPRAAGAFEIQVVDCVPTGPHDLKVDCIVTEARVIVAS